MLTGSLQLEDKLCSSDWASPARWIWDGKEGDWQVDMMVRIQGMVLCSCGGLACATGLAA